MINKYKAYHKARGITFPVSEIDFRRKRIKGRHEDEIVSARFDEVELSQEGVVEFDEDFQHALISYERYALGRRTYVVGMCTEYLTKFLKDMSDKMLSVLQTDLEHPLSWGDPLIDKPDWLQFKADLEKEIQKRKEAGTWEVYR